MQLVHTEEIIQAKEVIQVWGSMQRQTSVPPLFRQTPISSAKRREPTRSGIPAQRHDRRSRNRHQ